MGQDGAPRSCPGRLQKRRWQYQIGVDVDVVFAHLFALQLYHLRGKAPSQRPSREDQDDDALEKLYLV